MGTLIAYLVFTIGSFFTIITSWTGISVVFDSNPSFSGGIFSYISLFVSLAILTMNLWAAQIWSPSARSVSYISYVRYIHIYFLTGYLYMNLLGTAQLLVNWGIIVRDIDESYSWLSKLIILLFYIYFTGSPIALSWLNQNRGP